uniref:Uncharacterized protein n=1 Tax=Arundo donax TaxID=35708 RepID=A0A0A9AZK1_ARUDO
MSSGIPSRGGARTEAPLHGQYPFFESCSPSVRDKFSTTTTIWRRWHPTLLSKPPVGGVNHVLDVCSVPERTGLQHAVS